MTFYLGIILEPIARAIPSIHYTILLKKIYTFWNKKKIATVLFLDVTEALDNVFKDRLLYNLRIKKIDFRIVN